MHWILEDGHKVVESDDHEGVPGIVKKEVSEEDEDILENEDCKDINNVAKEKVKRKAHQRVQRRHGGRIIHRGCHEWQMIDSKSFQCS